MARIPITTSLSTQQRFKVYTNLNLDSSYKATTSPPPNLKFNVCALKKIVIKVVHGRI
jgi:hypothetical protein